MNLLLTSPPVDKTLSSKTEKKNDASTSAVLIPLYHIGIQYTIDTTFSHTVYTIPAEVAFPKSIFVILLMQVLKNYLSRSRAVEQFTVID